MILSYVVPFEPISTENIPSGKNWKSQVKWDGVRILVYYDGKSVSIKNRKLNDRTIQYPELTSISSYCSADSVILDGEVIALENGKPSFHQVMKRDSVRKQSSVDAIRNAVPVIYMIFDVLYVNGRWVTDSPLHERQKILSEIITEGEFIQLVKNHDDANALFNAVTDLDLEGIIIKDLNSKYLVNGKDKRWKKKKVFKDLLAVVGGVTYRSTVVNALMLGLYDELGQLWYIGHAGSGKLTQADWMSITKKVDEIHIGESPFVNEPGRKQGAIWIKPQLTVKIQYLEWTKSKTLRQPVIQSFVNVDPKVCTFGQG